MNLPSDIAGTGVEKKDFYSSLKHIDLLLKNTRIMIKCLEINDRALQSEEEEKLLIDQSLH